MEINKITVLILFCFLSCNYSNKKEVVFESKIKKEWIIDSLGCEGKRSYIVRNNFEKFELFKNKELLSFQNNFGKPNELKINKDGSKIFIYWIGCRFAPKPKLMSNHEYIRKKNQEIKVLLVEVNEDNIIVSLNLIVP